jgi:transposase InsO family protein
MKFAFIEEQREIYPVRLMCRVLGVSSSGYYAWRKREPSARQRANEALLPEIQTVYENSRCTYGSPRIQAELQAQGIPCSQSRVARLMRQIGLRARCHRRYRVTTQANDSHPVVANVLARDFTAQRVNQKWLADITYINTHEGWLYLAAVLDVFSRRIVGWAMQKRMTTTLVTDALHMALGQRQRTGDLLHHSDRGSQYTSYDYQSLLKSQHITASMSGTGNCYDNAMMESFFASLKAECVTQRYSSRASAKHDIFEYIEVWYNRKRRHSALGYLSPATFEQLHL